MNIFEKLVNEGSKLLINAIIPKEEIQKVLESYQIVNKIVQVASLVFFAIGVTFTAIGLTTLSLGGLGLIIPGVALSYLSYNTFKICLHLEPHLKNPFINFFILMNISKIIEQNDSNSLSLTNRYPIIEKNNLINEITEHCFFGRPVVWLAVELLNGALTLHLKSQLQNNN